MTHRASVNRVCALLVAVTTFAVAPVDAQERGRILESLPRVLAESGATLDGPANRQPTNSPQPRRSATRIVLGAAAGAVGGFFAGGFLGAAIDGECDCDDPGFKGFLIGAPIGAIAGGIAGGKWLF